MFPAKMTAATLSTLPTFSLGHEKEITLEGEKGLDIVQQLVVKGTRGIYTHRHALKLQVEVQTNLFSNRPHTQCSSEVD